MSSIDNQREEVLKEEVEEDGAMCCRKFTYVGLSSNICETISLDMWGMLQGPIQLYEDFNFDLGRLA